MSEPHSYPMRRAQIDNLLLAVSRGAARLIVARRWRMAMDQVLGEIGSAARVDRAWLFRTYRGEDGEVRSSVWHEWGAPGTGFSSLRADPGLSDMPVRGPQHDHSVTFHELQSGRMYALVDALARPPLQRATVERIGIRSMIRAPVQRRGRLWGALGFDSVRNPRAWSDSEREALGALATLLSAVLEREAGVNVLWSDDGGLLSPALHAAAAAAIARLHGAGRLEDGTRAALELLALALHAPRVWVTENRPRDDGALDSVIVVEWHAPDQLPLAATPARSLPIGEALAHWYRTIDEGRPLRVERATASAAELAALDSAGLDGFVSVGIPGLRRRWHGTLCASRPQAERFNDAELRLMEALADALHAAHDRRQQDA